jgi:GMP synthase (glutamine-hydrolysing)
MLHRVRLERGPLGSVDLDDWSGSSSAAVRSTRAIRRAEVAVQRGWSRSRRAARRRGRRDFPFLGACYGIGVSGPTGRHDRPGVLEPIARVPSPYP